MENLNAETVKKALELCANEWYCGLCEFTEKECALIKKNALALINSLEERIKELAEENERLKDSTVDYRNIPYIVADARADTVRKMQERVLQLFPCDKKFTTISRFTIDQVAKEMLKEE
jgi:hypothetical protein